jgi:hypothetical protein
MRRTNIRSASLRSTVVFLALALLGGCVERQPELSPADRERIREHVSNQRPTPQNALNVQFENGVELIGYDVEPATVAPGGRVTLTWYWHARQDLDDGWQLFTHVADAAGTDRLNQDGVGVVREVYPPGRWEAGQYIKDVQEVTLPTDWGSNRAVFYLGLWNGPHRLAIRRGDNDGNNRVRAASLEVSSAPSAAAEGQDRAADRPAPARPATPPPTLTAARASGAITVDGRLDEAAWNEARPTAAFVNTVDGSPAQLRTTARMLWDDEHLYVAFDVADDFIQNTIAERDGHLWEQDAVEIMVDPDGDGRNYFEMQVSPTGQVFDTRYDTRRQPQPFGDVAWTSNLRARVQVRGTANDTDADQGYTAEIAIPWSAFAVGQPPASRPNGGQSWRVNLYVMDQRPAGQGQRSAGWSPTLERDFHVPARFARVTFAAPPAAQAAAPSPAAPGVVPTAQVRPEAAQALREAMARNPRLRQLGIQPPTVRNPQTP